MRPPPSTPTWSSTRRPPSPSGKATRRVATTPFAEFYTLIDGRTAGVDAFYWDEAAIIAALVD